MSEEDLTNTQKSVSRRLIADKWQQKLIRRGIATTITYQLSS